jgi:flavin-binding protein dodecin
MRIPLDRLGSNMLVEIGHVQAIFRYPVKSFSPLSRQSDGLEPFMSVAKITEIQSSSSKSFEDAIQQGIARAGKTLRNLSGAWIKSQKVVIEKGKITEYRVLLKVTFVLQD